MTIKNFFASRGFAVAIIAVSSAFILTFMSQGINSNNGVHPIGTDAVYLAGEACTINAELDRTIAELRSDFNVCSQLHEGYRAVHLVNQMTFTKDEVAEVTGQ